jgi:hypothetical protein
VSYTCNPSYSGGSNPEDQGSKPAQVNSSQDPILKIPITKKKKKKISWSGMQSLRVFFNPKWDVTWLYLHFAMYGEPKVEFLTIMREQLFLTK